jgi:hypothetical protein
VSVYQQAPDKSLNITTFPSGAKTEIDFDGEVGWTKDSNRGVRRLSGLELNMAKHTAGFNENFDLRHVFAQMELLGTSQPQGIAR